MTRKRKLLLIITLLLVAIIAFGLSQAKWLLETKLKTELAARGFEGAELTVSAVGPQGITFKNVNIAPLTLDTLTVDYDLLELFKGNLREIHSSDIIFKHDQLAVTLGKIDAVLLPSDDTGTLRINWNVSDIVITGTPVPIPTLKGQGSVQWLEPNALIDGELFTDKKSEKSVFSLKYDNGQKVPKLTVKLAMLPWNKGMVRIENVAIPNDNTPITIPFELKHISLDGLLSQVTGGRATATGYVSGTLPLVISRDGNFTFKPGTLKTDEEGTLSISPEIFSGDNPQVVTIRDLMQSFHYVDFSCTIESNKDNKLSMLLSLRGNNPNVYNGKEVKLNVNLKGDLLELIQQSITSIDDPQRLIEQGSP